MITFDFTFAVAVLTVAIFGLIVAIFAYPGPKRP
jgi:hypothetical protein